MYFFKKYLKLLRLYFRYRYVSLPDCLATMSARGSGRTWIMVAKQSGSQPAAGFRAEPYAWNCVQSNRKILCEIEVYCTNVLTFAKKQRLSRSARQPACKIANFAPNRTQHKFFKSNRKILCESDQAGF